MQEHRLGGRKDQQTAAGRASWSQVLGSWTTSMILLLSTRELVHLCVHVWEVARHEIKLGESYPCNLHGAPRLSAI